MPVTSITRDAYVLDKKQENIPQKTRLLLWQTFSFAGLKPQNFGFTFLTFFILFNNLIPISLPVTLEVTPNLILMYIALQSNNTRVNCGDLGHG